MLRRREEMEMKPNFRQKLLDDLRLRKERMGLVPAGERMSPAATAANGYKNSRWSFPVSGEATNNRNISDINTAKIWINNSHQAPSLERGSQEIVPFSKNRTREHAVDLSMALALALSNSGKLQNIEILGNPKTGRKIVLHMDDNMTRPNAYKFLNLSPSQMGEIAKGVQNLNMILRTCSNGFNFSRDSIDIGRELLKGAMDLEESLKMLVTLQDASDYMVGSQGKQQFKLLKDKEEDESPPHRGNQRKTGNRTSFSFIRHAGNAELAEQKQKAVSYNEKSRYTVTSSINSTSRSSSHGNHELERFLNDGTSSNSRHNQVTSKANPASEKARIPNVIAKLMGLEELPATMEAKSTEARKSPRTVQIKEIGKLVEIDQDFSEREVNITASSNKRIIKVDAQEKVLLEEGMTGTVKNNMKSFRNTQNKSSASNDAQKAFVRSNRQMDANKMDHSCQTRERKEQVLQEETPTMKQQSKGKIEHNVPAIQKSLPDLKNDTRIKKKEVILGRQENVARKQLQKHVVDSHYEQKRTLTISDVNRDSNSSKKGIVQREELVLEQQRDGPVTTSVLYQSNKERKNEPAQQPTVHNMKTGQEIQEACTVKEPDAKGKLQPYVTNQRVVKYKDMEKHPQRMRTKRTQFSKENANSSIKNKTGSQSPKENSKIAHNGKPSIKNKTICNHLNDKKFIEQSLKERLLLRRDTRGEKKAPNSTQAAAIMKPTQIQSLQQVNILKVREGDASKKRSIEIPAQHEVLDASQSMEPISSTLEEQEYSWKERNNKVEGPGHGSEEILDLNLQQGAKNTTGNIFVEDNQIKITTCTAVVSEETKTNASSSALKGDESMQTTADQSTQEINVKFGNENGASQQTDSSCETMMASKDVSFQENSWVKYPEPQSKLKETRNEDPTRTAQLNSSKSIGCQERTTLEVDQIAENSCITITTPASDSSQEKSTEKYTEPYSIFKEKKKEESSMITQLNDNKSSKCQQWATVEEIHQQDALTKDEVTLKQILTKSQVFLNITQAYFQINIPIDILQATESVSQDKDVRLVVDCGCELVGRKGKVEELSFPRKESLAPLERTSLDTLIKEMNGDLENLNYVTHSERSDYDLANCLNKMIEKDIQNRNPNINALWAFGWDSFTFAFLEQDEIGMDIEKHVLNGLLNELVGDLLNVRISMH